jgi:hypothetical protein
MQMLFKFKSPLLKPKPKLFFSNFYFEFPNSHIGHFTKLPMITMALKWHHKNIFNKITILKEFLQSSNIVFYSFDCDYTHMASWLVLLQCKNDGVSFNPKKGSWILKCKNFLPPWKILISLISNNGQQIAMEKKSLVFIKWKNLCFQFFEIEEPQISGFGKFSEFKNLETRFLSRSKIWILKNMK